MGRIGASLVVAAVVKDNARTVGRTIRRLAGLAGRLRRLAFVVYENNSTDGTKEILRRLAREVPCLSLESEDLTRERLERIATVRHKDGRLCRIEILAYARERAKEKALREFGDYDSVLVVDADSSWLSLRGLERNLARVRSGEFDCAFANGMTKWLAYRDAFALRSAAHPYGPEFLGWYWWDEVVPRIQRRLGGKALIPVYSAFGGAALYSMPAFAAGTYSAIPGPAFAAAQGKIDLSGAAEEERRAASPVPIPNSNYSGPIVCEHVPFHYAMRDAGYGRMFIDPSWRMLFLD